MSRSVLITADETNAPRLGMQRDYAHRNALGMLNEQILLPRSYHMVTGDCRLCQIAKSWFQVVRYRQNSFDPTHPKSHKPRTILFALRRLSHLHLQYRTCRLSCSCKTWRLRTIILICLMEHQSTCMKCLPRPWLLFLLAFHSPALQDQGFPSLCTLTTGYRVNWFGRQCG